MSCLSAEVKSTSAGSVSCRSRDSTALCLCWIVLLFCPNHIRSLSLRRSLKQSVLSLSSMAKDVSRTTCETVSPHHSFDSPFLSNDDAKIRTSMALVILNSPIQRPPSLLFDILWNMSSFRVCADGGANRLYDATMEVSNSAKYVPQAICGDLDSLRPTVRAHYEQQGIKVEKDEDQYRNDLDKALRLVDSSRDQWVDPNTVQDCPRVCVYGAFGGRFDQEMGCIQALYKWGPVFDNRLVLYDDQTCAFLLPPNVRNHVRLPFFGEAPENEKSQVAIALVGEGPTCGLIPIGGRCDSVKTTGLKWDLDGTVPTEFGGLVSTSNRVMADCVSVEASHPLVFTAEMTSGR